MKAPAFAAAFALLAAAAIPLPVSGGEPPLRLDDAHIGPASEKNPFFGHVMKNPVTDGEWIKVGENGYIAPSGQMYTYDPALASFDKAGKTDQSGEYTFDTRGLILRRFLTLRDEGGGLSGYQDFSGFVFDTADRLFSYTRIDRDAGAALISRHVYTGLSFDDKGEMTGFVRMDYGPDDNRARQYTVKLREDGSCESFLMVHFGADGQEGRESLYDSFSFDQDGRCIGYRRSDRDAEGKAAWSSEMTTLFHVDSGTYSTLLTDTCGEGIVRSKLYVTRTMNGMIQNINLSHFNDQGRKQFSYNAAFNQKGEKFDFVRNAFDRTETMTGSTQYSDYAWSGNGAMESFSLKDWDSTGRLLQDSAYRSLSFDDKGRLFFFSRIERDQNGNISAVREYGSISYDGSGRVSYFTRTDRNADGDVTAQYEFSNRAFDREGSLAGFDWVKKDRDGAVIKSGTWKR